MHPRNTFERIWS